MSESRIEEQPTPLTKELLDKLRQLLAQGRGPSFTNLKLACPGHSQRDYAAALRLYKQEREQAARWSDSLPQEIQEYGRLLSQMAWSYAKEHFSKMLTEKTQAFNLDLDEARTARENCEREKSVLEAQLKQIQAELLETRSQLEKTKAELEKAKTDNAKKDAALEITAQKEKTLLEFAGSVGELRTLIYEAVDNRLKYHNGKESKAS